MRTRFRQVLPRGKFVWAALSLYVALWAVQGLYTVFTGANAEEIVGVQVLRAVLITAAAFGYGVHRRRFHPLADPAYSQWLALSPWTLERPLPLGPATLVWEDVAVAAVLVGAVAIEPLPREVLLAPPVALLAGYVLSALSTLTAGGQTPFAVAIGALLPLTVYPRPSLVIAANVLLMCYVLAWLGINRSLAAFPWNTAWWTQVPVEQFRRQAHQMATLSATTASVWPQEREPETWPLDKVVPAVLLAWYYHAALHLVFEVFAMPRWGIPDVIAFGVWVVFLLGSTRRRWRAYFLGYRAPLSLLARLATFRLVIPGYDRAKIAPLAALAVAAVLLVGGIEAGWSVSVYLPVSLLAGLLINALAPPRLQAWRMTGQHSVDLARVAPPQKRPAATASVVEE